MGCKNEDHAKEEKSLETKTNSHVVVHVLEELLLFLNDFEDSHKFDELDKFQVFLKASNLSCGSVCACENSANESEWNTSQNVNCKPPL